MKKKIKFIESNIEEINEIAKQKRNKKHYNKIDNDMSSEEGDPKTPYNEISDEQLKHIENQEF